MKYLLLTGSTGFLGRYLLKDFLLADVPVAVMVRANKRESALQRIEAIMAHWEGLLERPLPRPVVFEGDVRQPGCGLSDDNIRWLRGHCDTIVHSAASMNFHASQPGGEPFFSNIQGTEHLLAVCESAGIRHFHQVSTAYICGLRTGRILETELDQGQELGNDYERSKLAAEKKIRAARFLESTTFYRPASVLGDSQTGYTTNFHGFYAPLQVLYSMAKGLLGLGDVGRQIIHDAMQRSRFMDRLNLRGDEGKNLVPVDWVSSVLTHVLLRPQLHGRTYHLTPTHRTTVQLVSEVFEDVLREFANVPADFQSSIEIPPAERETSERLFREQMTTYDSHWRDDPYFDCANTLEVAPHLPCPVADREMLLRTSRYAVNGNFGWPRPQPVELTFHAADCLRPISHARGTDSAGGVAKQRVGLQVTGPGGGQWSFLLDGAAPVAAEVGLAPDCSVNYHLNSRTLAAITRRQVTVEQALSAGLLVLRVAGDLPSSPVDIFWKVVTIKSA